MKYILTEHAKKRSNQRSIPDPNKIKLFDPKKKHRAAFKKAGASVSIRKFKDIKVFEDEIFYYAFILAPHLKHKNTLLVITCYKTIKLND